MNQYRNVQHETKYKVINLEYGNFALFDCLEDARSYCLTYGGISPLSLYYPLYI